ncbi:MAG TPA: LLM class flavin-dependent oxidoreductase [Xanthobacteraceae bacterium]|jgi:alkanesulfonate monooxygenase SsuD/methylene tetrahydromethanopterin reductase-like flavin-dependent oxidoreductase (luciferase family)|nr:LLM class flavin-dependent oxidoreductase [Xanthobacteraceae bacterium]
MDFGIFDHLDRSGLPLHATYEMRLKLAELYDRHGFYSYHVAEHHATPLGLASSPGMFLSALAQRTQNLRFGPLVYLLPLYHPLRLIEEICMLDQMSGGRYQVGVGRGSSPVEASCYALNPDERQGRFEEVLQILLQGLGGSHVDFKGQYYAFSKVPMELAPVQKPYPPIWLGVGSPDSAERAARNGHNVVGLGNTTEMRAISDRFRATWKSLATPAPMPKLGVARMIVVGETDEQAMDVARRAYRVWHDSFHTLYRSRGVSPRRGERAATFDETTNGARGIAGSPKSVITQLRKQLSESGVNYCVGQFAFGDMSLDEAKHSISLFAEHVMPALRDLDT